MPDLYPNASMHIHPRSPIGVHPRSSAVPFRLGERRSRLRPEAFGLMIDY
jgi:hypothetical protein